MKPHFYIAIFVIGLLFTDCSQKMVCPAYQSAFLLDEDARNARFSLFEEDSIPKEDFLVYKDDRGLMAGASYRGKKLKKRNRLDLVIARPVYPSFVDVEIDSIATYNELDSLMEGGELPDYNRKPKNWPAYNRDQRVYEELFGEYLYGKDEKPKELEEKPKKKCWLFRIFDKKKEGEEELEQDLEEEKEEEQPAEDAGQNLQPESNSPTN